MRLLPAIPPPVLTIITTGFAATVAQIIIVRELLVIFYGNELSTGLIFAGWLLWSGLGSGLAGKIALRIPTHDRLLRRMLVGLSLLLPLSVLFIRATRIIWILPAGELPSIGKMLLISGAVTGLFCPLTGALFGVCWAIHRRKQNHQPFGVYLGEALGSAAAGLIFCFFFLPLVTVFTTLWIVSGIILIIAGWMFRPWWPITNVRWDHGVWIAAALLVGFSAFGGARLERVTRRWQWGPHLSAVIDTAFYNIALQKNEGRISVFTNGLWLFSEPDRLSAEYGVHLALLQHPEPKSILLLGGGIAGLLDEMFRQPGIQTVDYVEPDPDFIRFLQPHLSPATRGALRDPRMQLFQQDPRIFMRRTTESYDVILMNVGDPITAQMNRFYTKEFFSLVKQRLSASGIFSFAVSGGESMLGPTQARFLGSINKTLLAVFAETLVYPGDPIRFMAAGRTGGLLADASALAQRIDARNLQLTYIRKEILQDALSPWRLAYLKSVLEGSAEASSNRDFFPICYFHNLMMWANQWHAGMQKSFQLLAAVQFRWLLTALAAAGAVMVAVFWTGHRKFRLAVAGSIVVSGAVEMVLQVLLLLGFQIVAGFVYRQLTLIIAFFMTGLAVGAGWMAGKHRSVPNSTDGWRRLIRVQALICVLPVGAMLFFKLMQGQMHRGLTPGAMGWLFSAVSLITGMLGGMHFALAVMAMAATGVALEKVGGGFYALDLAGAATGVLLAALFVVPVHGIPNTLVLLSAVSAFSLLTLLRRP
jgi:spermidine synthase